MKNCSTCKYGPYDSLSDVCDGCMCDPETGWGGFYDHRVNKHFMSEEEQRRYYEEDNDDDNEDNY